MPLSFQSGRAFAWTASLCCAIFLASINGPVEHIHAEASAVAPEQMIQHASVDTLLAQLDDSEYKSRIIDMAADAEGDIYFIQESRSRGTAEWTYFYKKISSVTGKLSFAPFGSENLSIPNTLKIKPSSIYYDSSGRRMLVGGYSNSDKKAYIKTWDSTAAVVSETASRYVDIREFTSGNLFMPLDRQRALFTDLSSRTMEVSAPSGSQEIAIPGGNTYHRRIRALQTEEAVYVFDTESKMLSVLDKQNNKLNDVRPIELSAISAVTTYEGAFYLVSDKKLYRLTTDGSLSSYYDLNDVNYKWGLFDSEQDSTALPAESFGPIGSIDLIAFDHQRNLVIYDDAQRAIRRVNLFVEPMPPRQEETIPPPPLLPATHQLREQPSIDSLAYDIDRGNKQWEAIDLAVGHNGEALILLQQPAAEESDAQRPRALTYYNADTGQIKDSSFDENYQVILKDSTAPSGLLDVPLGEMIPKKLAYNPLSKEIWIATRYPKRQLSTFFRTIPNIELKSFLNDSSTFSDKDFILFTENGQLVSSSISEQLVHVRPLETSSDHAASPGVTIPVAFSGSKTAAIEKDGAIYIYDSGWQALYALESASGNITGVIPVQQSFDHVIGYNGLMLGLSGTAVYRLKEDGTTTQIADLRFIPVNKGIYDPAAKKYRAQDYAPTAIQSIRLISMDIRGNLYIVDEAGVLWRVNLFE